MADVSLVVHVVQWRNADHYKVGMRANVTSLLEFCDRYGSLMG